MAIHTDNDQDLPHLLLPAVHPGTTGKAERRWRLEQIAESYRQLASGQRRLLRFLTGGAAAEIAESATQHIDAAERQLEALGVDEIYLGAQTKERRDCGRGLR